MLLTTPQKLRHSLVFGILSKWYRGGIQRNYAIIQRKIHTQHTLGARKQLIERRNPILHIRLCTTQHLKLEQKPKTDRTIAKLTKYNDVTHDCTQLFIDLTVHIT
jgi:hypothetical protein